jgi:hypothetical protein
VSKAPNKIHPGQVDRLNRKTVVIDHENWDHLFALEKNPIIIDNIKPLEKKSKTEVVRTRGGILSPSFGVDIKENEDSSTVYKCECGELGTIANDGVICETCGKPVRLGDGLITTRGWIQVAGPNKILTPNAWAMCKDFFKRHFLKIIDLDMSTHVNIDGEFIPPEVTPANKYYGIGYWALHENFKEILEFYFNFIYCKKGSPREQDVTTYNLLRYFYDSGKLYASNISVITPLLREAVIIPSNREPSLKYDKKSKTYIIEDQKPTLKLEALNGVYAKLVANVNEYNKLLNEGPAFAYDVFASVQTTLTEIPAYIFKDGVVGGKEGYINSAIHGGMMNFTGRAVIVPMDRPHECDEVELPWRVFLRLMKYELVRAISLITGEDILGSQSIWEEAYETGSTDILEQAISKVKSESHDGELYCLINRPPTLLIGSILFMRITSINRSLDEKCMRVSHMVLGIMNGDHDGDSLIIMQPKTASQLEAFKKISPKRLIVDKVTGRFNSSYAPAGPLQALIGLYSDPDSVSHL